MAERVTGRRVAAGFIDLIPLVLISIGLGRRVETEPGFEFRLEGIGLLLMVLISLGYYFVLETVTGTTAGKRLMGITVVDADGGRPGAVTVLKRTLLRIVDALPAFYLVGFICVLATPDKRRVGDMVAHTRVVSLRTAAAEAERTGRPRSGTRAAIALLVGAVALVGGVIGTVVRITETSSADRLGHFEVDQDMEPRIRDVMAAFENPTTSGIEALFADGATDTQAVDELLSTVDNAVGAFTGNYTIIEHQKILDADVSPLGRHDLMQFKLTAEFEQSTPTVIITFAVLDGQLEMIGWNVNSG
jgi:uncharacterized RDD family membrane protein YckC